MRVGILFTWGRHLYNRIITLRRDAWARKASLSPPLFIEVSVPSQESERSCICVLHVSILPLSTIFILDLEMFQQCNICCLFDVPTV
jgi:hypothetical protein